MRSRVELFEQIRRDKARENLSIHALAENHGVHRRTVRQALASATPPPRKQHAKRPSPKLGEYHRLIDEWLEADRQAPRKQRHTAHRVWRRLLDEHGAMVSERAVRAYVSKKKRELAIGTSVFVPQAHSPAQEAQVDWGEADVLIGDQMTHVHLFVMRASHSGAAFVRAYPRQTLQAFLDAHARAFAWFGGSFATIRYDNLKSAVKQVLRGRRRIEADRFVALRSHYLFDSSFTTAGIAGAHEKGGVEGEVGRFRRNHLVPVPIVDSMAQLNSLIKDACEQDLARTIAGRTQSVGARLSAERPLLGPLPHEAFDASECARSRVSQKALVTVRQNQYSVPARLAGLTVDVRVGADEISVFHAGQKVALHERSQGRSQTTAKLDHYLDLLAERPGAFVGSLALEQERGGDQWPECFDQLWRAIETRYSPAEAARQMVDVLLLCRAHGPARVELAVKSALTSGAFDGRAVAVLAAQGARSAAPAIELDARLLAIGGAAGPLSDYEQLVTQGAPR